MEILFIILRFVFFAIILIISLRTILQHKPLIKLSPNALKILNKYDNKGYISKYIAWIMAVAAILMIFPVPFLSLALMTMLPIAFVMFFFVAFNSPKNITIPLVILVLDITLLILSYYNIKLMFQ